MDLIHNSTKVSFNVVGHGKRKILMLHGWADSGKSMEFFCNRFELNATYIIVDFPPFGNSGAISGIWGVPDYAEACKAILDELKVKKVDIISHSFGGRVAIYLSNRYTELVNKLLFVASAGIPTRDRWLVKLKVTTYKFGKKLGLVKRQRGSADYKNLSEEMRQTFSKIVSYNQTNQAKSIRVPSLIIAGEKDELTPLYTQKKLSRLIKTSKLIVFKGASHYAHYDEISKFVKIVNIFLKE